MRSAAISSARHLVLRVTIGSFAIAALVGITALLIPGRFGSVQGRILMTTLVIGATSVLMLCYLSIGDTRHRWLGVVGGVAALTSAACALDMFWGHWQHEPGQVLVRTFGVAGVMALTLAQFALLLALVRRRGGVIARLLDLTIAAGTVLAGLMITAVLGWNPGDGAARLIGVIAILDVLGTVVTIALGVFGGDRHQAIRPLRVELPEPLSMRLRARAEATGQDPAELVVEAATRYVESVEV
jgi:hypothetical protein